MYCKVRIWEIIQYVHKQSIRLIHSQRIYMYSIIVVLSHMFGYLEQKLLGRLRKSLFFLKSNFFGQWKISSFGTCFAEIKNFVL
jgi:hypothetical protein